LGDPKKKHKRYTTPKRPYDVANLEEELKLVGAYGLRNKRELWRHRTELSSLRRRAREMLSMGIIEREKLENELLMKLHKFGLVPERSTLDDILSLSIQDIMERRLQTVLFRKRMAKSLYQSRQLISHGHITIEGRKIKSPGYLVSTIDEENLSYAETSPLTVTTHPLRQDLILREDMERAPIE
jgi:small subunit ribosomal protein S4